MMQKPDPYNIKQHKNAQPKTAGTKSLMQFCVATTERTQPNRHTEWHVYYFIIFFRYKRENYQFWFIYFSMISIHFPQLHAISGQQAVVFRSIGMLCAPMAEGSVRYQIQARPFIHSYDERRWAIAHSEPNERPKIKGHASYSPIYTIQKPAKLHWNCFFFFISYRFVGVYKFSVKLFEILFSWIFIPKTKLGTFFKSPKFQNGIFGPANNMNNVFEHLFASWYFIECGN